MAQTQHWPSEPPRFSSRNIKLLSSYKPPKLDDKKVTVDDITRKSASFSVPLPINSVKCEYLLSQGLPVEVLERNINSAYPVLHETALPLFLDFLSYKRNFGSKVEQNFYKTFTLDQLVDRLLSKRVAVFVGKYDHFMLLDRSTFIGDWEIIGTDKECWPRILKHCLSYDEIKLSALLSVSSYTYFINDGNRYNAGVYCEDREKVEDFGVIIGLIGTRLTKPFVMEYQDVIVSPDQNIHERGYGVCSTPPLQGVFRNFYGEPNLTYRELKPQLDDEQKYLKHGSDKYFNKHAYEKRLSLSIDTLLLEANERGKDMGKMAYVFVVGLGLGVWKISSHQNEIFMDTFHRRIEYKPLNKESKEGALTFLGPNLAHISDICFSYIGWETCGQYKDQDIFPIQKHPNKGIKIHIGKKNPHDKLTGPNKGKLLVVSFAWDGNALPGNEFWAGDLTSSSDPAAASSTQIAELHNAHINPKVSAANLRIATLKGLVRFQDYMAIIKVQ